MTDKRTFSLYLYSTRILIITLLGLMLLGTAVLYGIQHIWSIPNWMQYAALTVLIVVAFVSSRYLSTRPAKVQIGERTITIEQNTEAVKTISLEEIDAYAYYEELILYSLKISLRSNETVSIISFKWGDKTDFQSFFRQFELLIGSGDNNLGVGPVLKSETFYGSRAKVVIGIGLLILYGSAAIALSFRGAFASWNPVWVYSFWVLPIAFFVKMWKAK